jgi:broad specificity phosphatase PhoE
VIECIKTLKYDTRPTSGSSYEYVCGLLSGSINPPSTADGLPRISSTVLYHSTLRRVVQTLPSTVQTVCIPDQRLNELMFDLCMYCSEEEWNTQGSVAVRRAFKQGFIENTLSCSRADLKERLNSLFDEILSSYGGMSVSLLSHSFTLSLIEAWVATSGDVFCVPERIHEFIHDTRKRFSFGERFVINESCIRAAM